MRSKPVHPRGHPSEKIIRDPVHDVVAFCVDEPIDAMLFELLNTAEFQRLRRIRQLGMASLAYPGADHSRYSHSLGVMQTARRMLAHLRSSVELNELDEAACLAASLLHDLGHGPFSHVFERVSGMAHELLTVRVIRDPESETNQILRRVDSTLPDRTAALLAPGGEPSFRHDLIASQLDADRFDYLLRDNLMTGSQYGGFDLTWLLHALVVDDATGRLAVSWKGVSAVEAYLQSRYHMYRNVYFHKVVRSAEGMVKLALQRAKRLLTQDRLEWPGRGHVVYKALAGQRLSLEEFVDLDDITMMHCFKVWMDAPDPPLAALCRGLLRRKLHKTIDLTHVATDADQLSKLVNAARQAVEQAGGDPAYDLHLDQPADTPYVADGPDQSNDIWVREASGKLTPFSKFSPLPQALDRQLVFKRLHVAAAYRSVAERAVAVEHAG